MFIHKSEPIIAVNVQNPDPVFAEKLLEQFGGATGELTAALTYLTQSYHTDDPGIRDMMQDIGTEELGHLEVVALLPLTDDEGTKAALRTLATREVAHAHMFMEALHSLHKMNDPLFGDLKPDDTVNVYYNLASGPGSDLRGPWNKEPPFHYVANPYPELRHEEERKQGAETKSGNKQ